jgi:hypothetical protein
LHDTFVGGGDDGLIQRFQLAVFPDPPPQWRNVDRWPDRDTRTRADAVYGEQRFANISDATNCIMTAVRLGGAQMEQEKASERVTHTMSRKFALGHVCGGTVYGYRRVAVPLAAPDPTGKRRWSHVVLEVDPVEEVRALHPLQVQRQSPGQGRLREWGVVPRPGRERGRAVRAA